MKDCSEPRRLSLGRVTAEAPLALLGVGAATASGYLAMLSCVSLKRRAEQGRPEHPHAKVIVLVPAHDEEAVIGRCVASLIAQDYPGDLRRIVVVADNCTDSTASVSLSAGAEVVCREEPSLPGKGRALRWAMDEFLSGTSTFDAFVVVDADSVAEPQMLRHLVLALEGGAQVVQGEYLALQEDNSAKADLRTAAFLLFHRVRFRGRLTLGLPCSLVGNGMLFSRDLIRTHPWQAFSSTEDLEYSLDLRMAGVRPYFAENARLCAPVSTAGRGARTQRVRWEGGRLSLARRRLPAMAKSMVRDGRWDLWDAVVDLGTPPLGVLASAVIVGGSAAFGLSATGVIAPWAVSPWILASIALPAHVLVGLYAGGAPTRTYLALLAAPQLVASEIRTRLQLLAHDESDTWVRTERP
jgi:1,2-diacylglycerol 3-beta-glucosyltransferase